MLELAHCDTDARRPQRSRVLQSLAQQLHLVARHRAWQGCANMTRFEQFIRFAIVGGVATAIQYAILIALVQGALAGAVAASSVGFAVSGIVNYALNRSITFRSSQAHAEALPKFAIVAVLGLAVNASLLWLF